MVAYRGRRLDASLAVATALQAVVRDRLKATVDAWAAAPPAQKEVAFHAAFAVRQVEVGLTRTLSLLLGLTVSIYAIALLDDHTYPKWVGGLAIVGGVPTTSRRRGDGIYEVFRAGDGDQHAASSVLLLWMLERRNYRDTRDGPCENARAATAE